MKGEFFRWTFALLFFFAASRNLAIFCSLLKIGFYHYHDPYLCSCFFMLHAFCFYVYCPFYLRKNKIDYGNIKKLILFFFYACFCSFLFSYLFSILVYRNLLDLDLLGDVSCFNCVPPLCGKQPKSHREIQVANTGTAGLP